jgi:hypothetical protein
MGSVESSFARGEMLGRLDLQVRDPGERDTNRGSITGEGWQDSAASRVELLADECQGEFVLSEMKLDDEPNLGFFIKAKREARPPAVYIDDLSGSQSWPDATGVT